MSRERLAISAIFLLNGTAIGVWAAFIPILKERLALGDDALALILFGAAVGAIFAMPISGALCDRYGSRSVTTGSAIVFGLALGCATAAPVYSLVTCAAFVMGAGNGAMDVAMNVNGVTLQSRSARPVMSSLHALFSVGTFVAAGSLAVIVALRLPLALASIGIAALVLAVAVTLRPMLSREERKPAAATRASRRIPMRLLLLGVAAICSAVAEGALVQWSGVYLRESLHVGLSAALGGFAAYSVAMSGSRFGGDWLVHRFGPVTVVRASGLLGAAGLTLALGVHTYPAVVLGFFITGLGLANVSPLVYGAGGENSPTGAGAGVAVVTTLGYSGFLIGPALIGFTAARSSIDMAFALIAGFAFAIGLLAPVLRNTDRGARS